MTFYLKPPRGYLNLHKLEECVKQRLLFYNKIEDENLENLNFDCLIEDSSLDRTGHYLLRLLAFSNFNFKFTFIKKEKQLLDKRLSSYNLQDVRLFLKRMLRQAQDSLQNEDISDLLKNMYIKLVEIFYEMLEHNYLKHIFSHKHYDCDESRKFALNVPFQYCHSLIGTRAVDLDYGFAVIHCKQWKSLLVSLYETYLLTTLKEIRFSRNVEDSLDDNRVKEILKMIGKFNSINMNVDCGKQSISIDQVPSEAKLFPLCMFNLYNVLQNTNRLAHNDRFDFSLFLKGIGMSMNNSLKFWETAYSKNHASCSRCTHDWQENEKRYIYGIRHLYGFEGSRRSYNSRSCNFLQEKVLGIREDGGCPFKHFDDNNLKKILMLVIPDQNEEVEVIIHKRKADPKLSCRLLHQLKYKEIAKQEVVKKFVLQSPVQYYTELKNGIGKLDS